MKQLSESWVTDGTIDFELKQYQLLDYLQHVRKKFDQVKLYPWFADLIRHYHNLLHFQKLKSKWSDEFPRELSAMDLERFKLTYNQLQESPVMQEISDIVAFAEETIKPVVDDGGTIYDHVENQVAISPIGLLPIERGEGYLFLHQPHHRQLGIYRYSLTIFQESQEKYRGINTSFVRTTSYPRFSTLESIKRSLTKEFKELPNPATYYVTTTESFPEKETLFPVTKRYLIRYLAEN